MLSELNNLSIPYFYFRLVVVDVYCCERFIPDMSLNFFPFSIGGRKILNSLRYQQSLNLRDVLSFNLIYLLRYFVGEILFHVCACIYNYLDAYFILRSSNISVAQGDITVPENQIFIKVMVVKRLILDRI